MIPVRHLTATELPEPDVDAGCGALRTERGNLPLHSIDIAAQITGLAVRTQLTQGFHNPFDEPLEATYIFPLPDRAALTALSLHAAGRVVDGVLRERGQARADYQQAIDAGQRAAIVEEERPGVFTMRVGNIAPHEQVTVRVVLAGLLPFDDGEATFRFPLVVAPRYIPGQPLAGTPVGTGTSLDTDAVPDASRITPPVLLPGFPNPVALTATVDIDPAGLAIGDIATSLPVRTEENGHRLRLEPGERANQDFILRLRLAESASSFAVYERTFVITVVPPAGIGTTRPRDVVLVLDRSGSMGGWKIVAARRAAARIVDTLTDADSFAVLAFDHTIERPADLPHQLVPANDRNRFRAVEYLAGLPARGGTEMLEPLRSGARLLAGRPDRDRVLVLVTDGQVGNEDQILQAIAPDLDGIRVHTVGIDTAVNAAFLTRLAALAGGRSELVESEDRLDAALRAIHHRIATPLVTDLRVLGDAVDTQTIAPQPIPDLFPAAPMFLTGNMPHVDMQHVDMGVTVIGRAADGSEWRQDLTAHASDNSALGAIWARARIRDLEDRYAVGTSEAAAELERQIVAISLEFGVLSRFTAFVAVDSRVVDEAGRPRQVTQPVDLPAGWVPQAPIAAAAATAGRVHYPSDISLSATEGASFGPARLPMPERPRVGHAKSKRTHVARELNGTFAPVPIPDSVREFAERAKKKLLESASLGLSERINALGELAESIGNALPEFLTAGLGTREIVMLANFAAGRAKPIDDEAALNLRWQGALNLLELLLDSNKEAEQRKPFWKR